MSADPFNFGSPPNKPPQPGGAPPSGGPWIPERPTDPFAAASRPDQGGTFGTGQAPGDVFGTGQVRPDAFGGALPEPSSSGSLTAAKPPTLLLFLAAGLAIVAAIVALVWGTPLISIISWLVAGPVAIGLIALFVIKDTNARASGRYAAPGWGKPLHPVTIVRCLVCILAPAWRIADWVGHL